MEAEHRPPRDADTIAGDFEFPDGKTVLLTQLCKGQHATTDYSKKAFEDGTRAFEQLLGAKSFEQVIEIQSQYAKNGL